MKPQTFALLLFLSPVLAQAEPTPEAAPLIAKAVEAAGGAEKLPRLFRMKEKYHSGSNPVPSGSPSGRESVLEPPDFWWVGGKDRTGEPAKFDVWAWTLLAALDAKSKVEKIPDLEDGGKALVGLRITETITPALDLYFDPATFQLLRMDWRNDIYRFSEFKEHDGFKYPAKTVLYRRKSGEPWFYHEITELQRLKELPAGIVK